MRIGLSGDNFPMLILPLVIGKSKHKDSADLTQTKLPDTFGKKALKMFQDKPKEYVLIYPMIEKTDTN